MKLVFIGHRGVGKSSLLQRIQIYLGRTNVLPVFDLDQYIERKYNQSVFSIFEMEGEIAFRYKEVESFNEIIRKHDHFAIALGAGFPLESVTFPKGTEVIWVRRASDLMGRIFLDRPRLNPEKSALEEYQSRASARSEIYKKISHRVYDLPEGLTEPCAFERSIIFNESNHIGGYLTVQPEQIKNQVSFVSRFFKMGIEKLELRDDILTENEIEQIIPRLIKEKVLISFRRPDHYELFSELIRQDYDSDWALELGPCPWRPSILSLHERQAQESLIDCAKRLEAAAVSEEHLKLAVQVFNFDEIKQGLQWQKQDPLHRSFLPRSEEGRWKWTRLWLRGRQKINFIFEGSPSSLDQPTLHEWLRCFKKGNQFAAVLGNPIHHSFSPIEHLNYFRAREMSFYAIQIAEDEWHSAFSILQELGLKACAVTAPLKKLAYQRCQKVEPEVQKFESVNSIFLGSAIIGTNTDVVGFRKSLEGIRLPEPIVVWGGGGTLAILQEILPSAHYYSVRSQAPRKGAGVTEPKSLIWAAGPQDSLPQLNWKPEIIIDLNYRDDSVAREYANQVKGKYISGLLMFKAQAKAQRDFWDQY